MTLPTKLDDAWFIKDPTIKSELASIGTDLSLVNRYSLWTYEKGSSFKYYEVVWLYGKDAHHILKVWGRMKKTIGGVRPATVNCKLIRNKVRFYALSAYSGCVRDREYRGYEKKFDTGSLIRAKVTGKPEPAFKEPVAETVKPVERETFDLLGPDLSF